MRNCESIALVDLGQYNLEGMSDKLVCRNTWNQVDELMKTRYAARSARSRKACFAGPLQVTQKITNTGIV